WENWSKSGKRPENIPSNPEATYEKEWKDWYDWLGIGFLPFEEAREFVHSLKLKSDTEWRKYCKSGRRPKNIPGNPYITYKNKGWKGTRDWLGIERIADKDRIYKSFEEAREYVHSLGLKNQEEWFEYCKSGKKPDDIPSYPNTIYQKEWKGAADWL